MQRSMEGRNRRGGAAHLITLIQEPICNRSPSANSNPRHRYLRPKSLFLPAKIRPIGSEPTSPKVNCAGQVTERAVPEVKLPVWPVRAAKKQNMFWFLACSLRCVGFDGGMRCCGSMQGLPPGDCDKEGGEDCEEEEVSSDSGKSASRLFMEAEGKDEAGFVETDPEGGEDLDSTSPPGNALQLMRGKVGTGLEEPEERRK